MTRTALTLLTLLGLAASSPAADWPQGAGPDGNFRTSTPAPTDWSVALDRNISWTLTLPETGQSTPVIAGDKVFFTTLKPVDADAELGSDLIAWCVDAANGEVLWKRDLPGTHPLRLSGCFGDSSSPPAVCDEERVVFTNASGFVACFDLDGEPLWSKETLTVNRTLPFIHDGHVVLTRQVYPPEPNGAFPHKYADAPKDMWTQLQALDLDTGEVSWVSECGVNMGCAILPQKLNDGRGVAVVGRGGGHGPPERPEGISLIDLSDGSTVWTLPLDGFMATMSFRIRDDVAHVFHGSEHLSVDATNGKVLRRASIAEDVPVRRHTATGWADARESLGVNPKKKRMITQTSNLLVGNWHYFRSYTQPWLGRVNVDTGAVEYLELPLQLSRKAGAEDQVIWFTEPASKKDAGMKTQAIAENAMTNSRGFVVFGDKRSKGNGWGHVAAPSPSVAGDHLYVPVQNGTVYVIRWDAAKLDENAIAAINDLGPAGQAYTRASLSFSGDRAFAHTIRELICIGE